MAKIYRYQLVICKDTAGVHTARMLDETDTVSVSNSKKDAILQIKEYLHYASKSLTEPLADYFEAKLTSLKVKIFAEYKEEKRNYAMKQPLTLSIPCVIGARRTGLFSAYLPTIDCSFDFHEKETLTELGQHYVRSFFQGMTPQQISRHLTPEEVMLEEISVSLKDESERSNPRETKLTHLPQVADHIGAKNYRKQNRTWERENELHQLENLLRNGKTSMCVVGSRGSGKTSILTESARKVELRQKELRSSKRNSKLFWLTSGARIIAGMAYLGQWQERLEKTINELSNSGAILCFESLHDLLQLGGESAKSSIAAFLLPFIQNDELRVVIETTPEEIEACDRELPGLIDALHQFVVPDFTESQSKKILDKYALTAQQQEKITFSEESTNITYYLFKRFLPYANFPGQPMQFMDSLKEEALKSTDRIVDKDLIWLLFSQHTGLPMELLQNNATEYTQDTLRKSLNKEVLGQPHAIETMANTIVKFKSGLNDPKRPLGVFLCCGPTGVGKTAMVKTLGNTLFGDKPEKDRLIRLDMSEYAGYDAAHRLLGSPHGKPSEFIRKVRANPFTIILLDEVEKASDEVFDILLNVFDEGRLTDSFGRRTQFTSTIIIMTSNLGAGSSHTMGFLSSEHTDITIDTSEVKRFFRPEFFNRLDSIVYFNALTQKLIQQIAAKEINDLCQREGLKDRKLNLSFDENVIQSIAKAGFDPKYGARPLQRTIENKIIAPLAKFLVEKPNLKNKNIRVSLTDTTLDQFQITLV